MNPVRWIAGYGDPNYIVYYEAFPVGPDKFWQVDEISVASVALIFGFAAFDIVPLAGRGVGKVVKGAFKAATTTGKEITEKAGAAVGDAVDKTTDTLKNILPFGDNK